MTYQVAYEYALFLKLSLTIPSSSIILKESWVMPIFNSFSLNVKVHYN